MRVFVTGATGFVGSAVVRELLASGHQVLGLARSEAGSGALIAAGAGAHPGSLEDIDSLTSGAAACDGVIHLAFNHDFSKFAENCEMDQRTIAAFGSALAGSDKPLVVTSATGLLARDGLATEADAIPADSPIPRALSERAADALVARGVHACVVRLPQVHGDGDRKGFNIILSEFAREKGISAYVGDGLNHWPAVHRHDAAALYRLALEKGVKGARYHPVAEEGVPMRDIASVIGRRLGLPVASLAPADAPKHFGWFAHFAMMDNRVSSAWTRETLGWHPVGPGLIADIDRDAYFRR